MDSKIAQEIKDITKIANNTNDHSEIDNYVKDLETLIVKLKKIAVQKYRKEEFQADCL